MGRGEAVAVADGTVAWVEARHPANHGMGNNVIIKHWLPGPRCSALYSSYSNLASLAVQVNDRVTRGQPLGAIEGFLHFELKGEAVTGNPWGDGRARGGCQGPNTCWGFTVGLPDRYGYVTPDRCLQRPFTQPAYRQISGNRDYGCALKPNGAVTCWGLNYERLATGLPKPMSAAWSQAKLSFRQGMPE